MMIHTVDLQDGTGYYVKGHPLMSDFILVLCQYLQKQEEVDGDIEMRSFEAPYYTWLRYNPDNSFDYRFLIADGTPGKQGTFPATMVHNRHVFPYVKYDKMPRTD